MTQPSATNLSVGDTIADAQRAASFTLPDTVGNQHSLADFGGKYVVLEWINHNCPFVRKHYDSGNMQKLQETYTAKGVVWLSICSSAPGKQGYFEPQNWNGLTSRKNAKPTAVLLDPEGTVGRVYGAKATPHMFVIDPVGRIIYQGGIDDKASVEMADIAGATNYVAATLDEALAGRPVAVSYSMPYGCSVKY